eukprot:591207-Hanusia_phi.AAC.3
MPATLILTPHHPPPFPPFLTASSCDARGATTSCTLEGSEDSKTTGYGEKTKNAHDGKREEEKEDETSASSAFTAL